MPMSHLPGPAVSSGPESASFFMFPTSFYSNGSGTFNWIEMDVYEALFGINIHGWVQVSGTQTHIYATSISGSATNSAVHGLADIPGNPKSDRVVHQRRYPVCPNDQSISVMVRAREVAAERTLWHVFWLWQPISCLIFNAGTGQLHTITKVQIWQAPHHRSRASER